MTTRNRRPEPLAALLPAVTADLHHRTRQHRGETMTPAERENLDELKRIHPAPWKLIPEHRIVKTWDPEGGQVLERTCTCGERWFYDEDDCPGNDGWVDEILDADGDVVTLTGVEAAVVSAVNAYTDGVGQRAQDKLLAIHAMLPRLRAELPQPVFAELAAHIYVLPFAKYPEDADLERAQKVAAKIGEATA